MTTPKLETDRLILRPIAADDVQGIFNCWMQDERVSRYMWWKATSDIADVQAFVKFELGNLEHDRWNRWIVTLKDSAEIIGTGLLYFNDDENHWDISYNLGVQFWGQGYATETMRAVMEFAVKEMKVKRIFTSYAAENPASGRVLQKLGFREIKEIPYECNGGEIITIGKYCEFETK